MVTIVDQNVPTINDHLARTGYQGIPVSTGVYANPVHSTNVLGKVDHRLSDSDQLSVRYALYEVESKHARNAGTSLFTASASQNLDNIDQSIAVGNVWTLSRNTINETRAQVSSSDLEGYAADQIGPQVIISGVATFGTFPAALRAARTRFTRSSTTRRTMPGAHALRAGVDFLLNDDTITFLRTFRGSYTFSSMSNFLASNYSGYAQTFGDPVVNQKNPNVGFFVQDEWRASSRLTLNFGFRYDLQFLGTISTDTNNVSPRVGFAWSPTASQGFLVRGGAGVF